LQEQYKSVGNEVRKSNLEAMHEQMTVFKDKLEEFAIHHRADIRKDPAFRAQFHAMCANIGVDPLASNKVSHT
jgi:ESCRT-II complex subunit VPS22